MNAELYPLLLHTIMTTTMPTKTRTSKGQKTRAALLDAAIELFSERGFEATTMRDISSACGRSPGLIYRYFDSKEALAVALYWRICDAWIASFDALEPGPVSARFARTTRDAIAAFAGRRDTLARLGAALLIEPNRREALMSPHTAARARRAAAFVQLVEGSTDIPSTHSVEALARLFERLHVLVLLFWLFEDHPDAPASNALIDLLAGAWTRAWPMLAILPGFGQGLALLDDLFDKLTRAASPTS